MWPWEHLAFGYLWYSLSARLGWDRSPSGGETVVLAVATQLPDLVDKPLSWGLGVFPSGYAAAHSVFVAAPLLAVAFVVAARRGRRPMGVAFAVGYASHLVGDVLYGALFGSPVTLGRVLWPVVTLPPYETDYGLVERFLVYFVRFIRDTPSELGALVAVYLLGLLGVVVLWVADGAPVARDLWRLARAED